MKKQHSTHISKQKPANAGTTPKGTTEKDPDDLVHSQEREEPSAIGEEDPDDLVHQQHHPRPGKIKEENLEDPDDLVHGYPPEDDPNL